MLEAENMLQFFAVSDLSCPRRSDGGVRREACGKIQNKEEKVVGGGGGMGKRKEVPSFSAS